MNNIQYAHINMKKLLILIIMLAVWGAPQAYAQGRHAFDPGKFEASLEQFITMEVALTPQEAASFFPIYRDMRKKLMVYFDEGRRYRHVDITDDKACEAAIKRRDNNDIKMKEIQQTYHNKFMRVLPAGKVLRIIRAEEKFHRQFFKRMAKERR